VGLGIDLRHGGNKPFEDLAAARWTSILSAGRAQAVLPPPAMKAGDGLFGAESVQVSNYGPAAWAYHNHIEV